MAISNESDEQFDKQMSENQEESAGKNEIDDEEHLRKLDPDKFVEAYGNYGKYQIITYVLVQTLNFFYSSSIYVMSFVQMNVNLECSYQNEMLNMSQTCVINLDHSHAKYKELNGETCGVHEGSVVRSTDPETNENTNLLMEFNLKCTHWFFQEFGLTIFTIAAIFAVPIMSMLADRYGRKPIIVISSITAFLANVAAAFSPSFGIFLVFRAIVGASSDTYLSVAGVATCEYISEKARAWITVVYNIAWSTGMVWTLLVTLMTADWRWRYFIVVCPGVYAFALWYFLPESPHWLIVKNKTEKLKKYIKTANKVNKKEPDFKECQQDNHHSEKHEGFKALLSSRKLLWILFANGSIQMVIAYVYFSISFLSAEQKENYLTDFLLTAVVEIPAGLTVVPLMMKLGRRTIVLWCLSLQTLALVGITAFHGNQPLELSFAAKVMSLIAKIMATITYTVHPIWATEQFPTSVRSLCFSLINIPQSLGIILSPYIKHIKADPAWLPFLIIGLFSFISTTLAYMLKETKNTKLPADVASLSNPSEVPFDFSAHVPDLEESGSNRSSTESNSTNLQDSDSSNVTEKSLDESLR